MHIASIVIDLGKTTFHFVAMGERNKILLRKKFSRSQPLAYTANLPSSLIGLEACAGSHFLGTVLRDQGHQVRLIPRTSSGYQQKRAAKPIPEVGVLWRRKGHHRKLPR